ncbi:MAG: hypothetical protein QW510_00280 [Candidatus Bathyarchaeia archaeon]
MSSIKHGENSYLLEKEKTNFSTCSACGEIFEKPILATVLSSGSSRVYYACPRCLTKVREVPVRKASEDDGEVPVKVVKSQGEAKGGCPRFFGFLKKRPKNMPIPDECLTCDKMIECLM